MANNFRLPGMAVAREDVTRLQKVHRLLQKIAAHLCPGGRSRRNSWAPLGGQDSGGRCAARDLACDVVLEGRPSRTSRPARPPAMSRQSARASRSTTSLLTRFRAGRPSRCRQN